VAIADCLIADRDGIYDPASTNGRLLLGLKGQLSEFELHTIRSRLNAGLLNKAERGDLGLALPVGLVRQADGQVRKDPNQEIQDRISLVFSTFLRVKSASRVLRFFREHQLGLPRPDRFGDLIWKAPSVAAILAILKNPALQAPLPMGAAKPGGMRPANPPPSAYPLANGRSWSRTNIPLIYLGKL
jgi:hypothetical protein